MHILKRLSSRSKCFQILLVSNDALQKYTWDFSESWNRKGKKNWEIMWRKGVRYWTQSPKTMRLEDHEWALESNCHLFHGVCVLSSRLSSVQFSSVAQSCLTLCDSMNHSMPGLPFHHQLLEFTQTDVHRVPDYWLMNQFGIPDPFAYWRRLVQLFKKTSRFLTSCLEVLLMGIE